MDGINTSSSSTRRTPMTSSTTATTIREAASRTRNASSTSFATRATLSQSLDLPLLTVTKRRTMRATKAACWVPASPKTVCIRCRGQSRKCAMAQSSISHTNTKFRAQVTNGWVSDCPGASGFSALYIRSGALIPSSPSVRAITRLVTTQIASRDSCTPSPSAPTTRQSR